MKIPKPSRCCGRCDGHNDECVTDQICIEHNKQGCETCWPHPVTPKNCICIRWYQDNPQCPYCFPENSNLHNMNNNKERGYALFYDRKSLPQTMTMKNIMEKIKSEHTCYYDSSLGGTAPKVMRIGDGDAGEHLLSVTMVDLFKGE